MHKDILSIKLAIFALPFAAFSLCSPLAEASDIEVMHFWKSASERAAIGVLAKAHQENGGEWLQDVSNDYNANREKSFERLRDGFPPTAMHWLATAELEGLLDSGTIRSIDEVISPAVFENVQPALLEVVKVDGKITAIPIAAHATNWTYYNADVMQRFGFEPPQDWETFFQQMERIAVAGQATVAIGQSVWENVLVFEAMLLSHGGEPLLEVRHSGIITPDLVSAFERALGDFIRFQKLVDQSGLAVETWDQASLAVAEGRASVQLMGDWAKGEMIANEFKPNSEFLCQMAPGNAEFFLLTLDTFVLPRTDINSQLDAQKEFVELVLDPENHTEFSRLKGSSPILAGIERDRLDSCTLSGLKIIDQHGYTLTTAFASHSASIFDALSVAIKKMMDGSIEDPTEARKEIEKLFAVARTFDQ